MSTNTQRNYFMEIIGDDPEFIEEVLVGCKLCNHRALTPTVDIARQWISDHHLALEHGALNTAVDLVGEQQNHHLSRKQAERVDPESRPKPEDRWDIISEAIGGAGGTIATSKVQELLGMSRQIIRKLLTEWVDEGKIEVCSTHGSEYHFCRAGDTEANEENKILKLLANGPASKPKICMSLGYSRLNLKTNALVDKLVDEGKVESHGSGPSLKFSLMNAA